MESHRNRPNAESVALALHDAETARAALVDRIATPSWFFSSIGVAIAVQIATTAAGVDAPWILAAGLAAFAAVGGVQLARFRQVNGVWLGGFASRVVLGSAATASVSYTVALGAAIWAAESDRWWLAAIWAAVGGAAYTLSGRRWMRTYRADPATHARGESLAWLALLAAAAIGGVALLMLNA